MQLQFDIDEFNIKSKVELILLKYMDGNNFNNGYIPDLYDVRPLRDEIVNLIRQEIKTK
jgi:hypothetical protein